MSCSSSLSCGQAQEKSGCLDHGLYGTIRQVFPLHRFDAEFARFDGSFLSATDRRRTRRRGAGSEVHHHGHGRGGVVDLVEGDQLLGRQVHVAAVEDVVTARDRDERVIAETAEQARAGRGGDQGVVEVRALRAVDVGERVDRTPAVERERVAAAMRLAEQERRVFELTVGPVTPMRGQSSD